MCIAIPMKVIEINGNCALCEYEGVRRVARVDLVEDIKVGDYVIVHVGFVLQKIDINDAMETIKLYEEIRSISNK
ncbi:MAG: HypC/HybG/HupF family hydrogenase formation chaperone [Endomicrobia bacterium]|nr:HypC/HybG/HupF family hydrogenase formation chaperone [Endomicrobiia bacterium]